MGRREIGREIHAVSNLLGRRIDAEKRQRGMQDITPVQTWIVTYLYDHRAADVFQKDIERDFTITRSTVTGILKLMEKNGLISRISVPEDARLKKLVLTQKGEETYHAVRNHIREVESMLIRGFSGEEKKTFLSLLDRIRDNLQC